MAFSIAEADLVIDATPTGLLSEDALGSVRKATLRGSQAVAARPLQPSAAIDREIDSLTRLRHPNVLPVYGVCHHADGRTTLIEELATGGTLHSRLHPCEGATVRLSLDEMCRLGLDIANALAYSHAAGVPHNCIKSSNILFNAGGSAVLAGYSLAKHALLHSEGALPWTAPENFDDECPHHGQPPGDVYSFGLLLFEMCTGLEPWGGKTLPQLVSAVCGGRRPALPAGTDARVRELIEKCWAQDPAARPTAPALVEQIESLRSALKHEAGISEALAVAERRARAADAEIIAQRARTAMLAAENEALRARAQVIETTAAEGNDKLSFLMDSLQQPGAEWDRWSIEELTRWCRGSVRAHPHQTSMAIFILTHENGALLDLACESMSGSSMQSFSSLRLRRGREDLPSEGAGLPEASPPCSSAAKLPLLMGCMDRPDADWDKWGIEELSSWCKQSLRTRPQQSCIAILQLSHESGALLDLVSESFSGGSMESDAALCLRKGRAELLSALGSALETLPAASSVNAQEASLARALRDKECEIALLHANLSSVSEALSSEVEKARVLRQELMAVESGGSAAGGMHAAAASSCPATGSSKTAAASSSSAAPGTGPGSSLTEGKGYSAADRRAAAARLAASRGLKIVQGEKK